MIMNHPNDTVGYNQIGDEGAKALAKAIETSKTLTAISLGERLAIVFYD